MRNLFLNTFCKSIQLLVVIFMLTSLINRLSAQNPSLMVDVNKDNAILDLPSPTYSVDGLLYFDGIGNEGNYLWKSDGTSQGTVKVTKPGIYEEIPSPPLSINGTIYYHSSQWANEGPDMLWKTNGTAEGTSLVTAKVTSPGGLTNYNGTLVFNGYDAATFALKSWKSDGTDAGTQEISTITIGPNAILNNKLVFANGGDMYVTDGTTAGTIQLAHFISGSFIQKVILYQNAVYFLAWNEGKGRSLYKTDGTVSGTVVVKDFAPSKDAEEAGQLVLVNNKLFMFAQDISHGLELWLSDGTTAGTQMVKDIYPGSGSAFEYLYSVLYPVGNRIYFYANDSVHGKEPWYSDGTAAGTLLLKDIKVGTPSSSTANFTPYGSNVIFTNFESSGLSSLYISDGTTTGTQVITTIPASNPSNFIPYNSKVFFKTYNSGDQWVTDGSAAGTVPVTVSIQETASSTPYQAVKVSTNVVVFAVKTENNDPASNEIWSSDGTPVGSHKIFPLNESEVVFQQLNLCQKSLNGLAFFDAVTGFNGTTAIHKLWRSDATLTGTFELKEVEADFSRGTVILNNILYFVTTTLNQNFELWRTDGTAAGTFLVKDINPNGEDAVDFLTSNNNLIYLSAADGSNGSELWKSDGTSAGTVLAVDINPGGGGSSPAYLASANGKLYFSAKQAGGAGNEPWISDGTPSGTFLLKDINTSTSSKGSDPVSFTASGPYVYFDAKDNSHGRELWRTDGTESGTMLVKDIATGKDSFDPAIMADVNGTLYFAGIDEYGEPGELWKTTGDEAHTSLVIEKDYTYTFSDLNNVNGALFAVASSFKKPTELWRTDGTSCHTVQVNLFPQVIDEQVDILTVDENIMYLALNSEDYGNELYKLTAPAVSNVEVCNGFDDDCNGIVDDNPEVSISPMGTIEACKGNTVTFSTEAEFNTNFQWNKNGNAIPGANESSFTTNKNESGNYSVTVNGAGSCTATSLPTVLDRLAQPAATITPLGNLDICSTGSVILQANSGSGLSYRWQRNGNIIPGAINQSFTATKKGNYTVTVTNANDCSKTSKAAKVISSCKESEVAGENNGSFNIYPNPVASMLTIKTENEESGKLTITNLLGEIVISQDYNSTQSAVDVSSLSNGLYLVRIQTAPGTVAKPLVKE